MICKHWSIINIQKETNVMNYRKIYENYHNCSLLAGTEIHHIDGNHENNDPDNLLAVSIEEHLDIHYRQKDWGAVQAILIRMDYDVENVKLAASKAQLARIEKGEHNFQKMSKKRRSEISKKVGNKTKQLKIGIHAINSDHDRAKENARNAGLRAKQLKAGFHDPTKTGSLFVKGTCWWSNKETGKKVRQKECPGEGWNRGMK